MGLNRQLANLPDAITTDTSNNVGIGGAANASFKLQVTGSGAFNGGATGLILSLDANVSVAKSISFRSNNSPRMSVEVSGTESGSNAGANFQINRFSDAGSLINTPFYISRENGYIFFNSPYLGLFENRNGPVNFEIQNYTAGTAATASYNILTDGGGASFGKWSSLVPANGIVNPNDVFLQSGGLGSIAIFTGDAAGTIKMAAGNSSTAHLTIASTGAATFSSSVGIQVAAGGLGGTLDVQGTNNVYNAIFKGGTTTGQSFGPYFRAGTNASDIAFQVKDVNETNTYFRIRGDGNVGIGEASPASKLSIGGTVSSTIASNVGLLIANTGAAATVGNLFQIGLHYNPAGATPASVIGAVLTSTSGFTKSDIFFATRDVTTDTAPTERMRITSGGNVLIGGTVSGTSLNTSLTVNNSSAGNYAGLIAMTADTQRGYYGGTSTGLEIGVAGSGYFSAWTSGSERMRISSAGRTIIKGGTANSSEYALVVENSTPANLFLLRNDGFINSGTNSASPYNNSTTGRSMVIESGGGLGYLSSTRESKTNIESIKNIDFINQLNAVQFNYRKKDDDTNQYTDEYYDNITYGFIADEVEKVNKELVFYKEDGSLAGVEYNNMIAILTKAVQEQQAQIEELKAEIDELKNK